MFNISESESPKPQDPYACSRANRERPQDGLCLGCLGEDSRGFLSQGSWAASFNCRKATHVGHLVLAPGRRLQGPWVTRGSWYNLISALVLSFFHPTQFSPPCSHIAMVLDPHETIIPISSPIFFMNCFPHPTRPGLSFTAVDMDFLIDFLMPFIWLIINLLPLPCCPTHVQHLPAVQKCLTLLL